MPDITFLEIWDVWWSGGIAMIPLFFLSLIIYGTVVQLMLYFRRSRYKDVPESTWSRWIENPSEGQGPIGDIIRYSQEDVSNLNEIGNRFAEVQNAEIPPVDRRIVFLSILVNLAPLLGLLGTVLGMLATFKAIATGGGNTIDLVADGIAVALITTQAGLTIAIPGFFMANAIKRKRNEYMGFLARLESMTMQHFKKKFVA